MVSMCRTCLAFVLLAHNVLQQREVLGVDGAVFVTLNSYYSHSEGVKRDGPVLRWERIERGLVVGPMHIIRYIMNTSPC